MPIYTSEPTVQKGKKDARRHREKQKEVLRENLPYILSDEAIITRRHGKTVKIPIRSLQIPRFRPKRNKDAVPEGMGQGSGNDPLQPGDIIDQRPDNEGGRPGEAGENPGEDYIESEVEVAELVELLREDLGLPKLEDKEIKQILVEIGYKIQGITDSGDWSLLEKLRTTREALKRFWSYLNALQQESSKDELTCFRALKQAEGLLEEALNFLNHGTIELNDSEVEPFPIYAVEDQRFLDIKKDEVFQSRAVIIAMMDVSGSMGTMKKYYSRSTLFWLVEFLKRLYTHVEIRFITHHITAKIVSEDDFFRTGESGGTLCFTAYQAARSLVETEYPPNSWNIYIYHFSDGDDYFPDRTIDEVRSLLNMQVNMIGYAEVIPNEEYHSKKDSALWSGFRDSLGLEEVMENNSILSIVGGHDVPFLGVVIQDREDIWPAIKTFLKKTRWRQ